MMGRAFSRMVRKEAHLANRDLFLRIKKDLYDKRETGRMKIISVSGSHEECGRQIGAFCSDELNAMVQHSNATLPSGQTRENLRNQALPYLEITERVFPWVVAEVRGAAQGANLDFLDLFTAAIEELHSEPGLPASHCSDFVVCPPATDEDVLIAHNNDLSPLMKDFVVAVHWNLTGEPGLFTLGPGGLFVSIGMNTHRMVLTGNEVSPNDEKIGVPRLLIARAILSVRSLSEGIQIACHPERASSYNNILSSGSGEAVSVEGSATDYELIYPVNGRLVHTNHYTSARMQKYERSADQIGGSVARYNRAQWLLEDHPDKIDLEVLKAFLADHHSSESICRHDAQVSTVFACLINATTGKFQAALGNPCENVFEEVFAIP